jgi:hypothetical protein
MSNPDFAPTPRRTNGTFAPGHSGYRPAGVGNKFTRDIRNGLIASAVAHGADGKGTDGLPGFFRWLLANDLKSWIVLFGRLLPLKVDADIAQHIVTQINIRPIESGTYLPPDEINRVLNQRNQVVDQRDPEAVA